MEEIIALSHHDVLMTGKEVYKICGPYMSEVERSFLFKRMEGFKKYWECIEKAKLFQSYFGGDLHVGRLCITSDIGTYRFEYNPPFEFHAWNQVNDVLFDTALPGAIEMGIIQKCLNIEPVILATSFSKVPDNFKYNTCEIFRRFQ